MVSSDSNGMSFKADSQLARVNPLPYLRVQPTCGLLGLVVMFVLATTSGGLLDADDAESAVRESDGNAEQAARHKTNQDTVVEIILAELAFGLTVSGTIQKNLRLSCSLLIPLYHYPKACKL